MKYVLLVSLMIIFQYCNQQSVEKKIGNEIAAANGIKNFEKVQMLEFTFNAQRIQQKHQAVIGNGFQKLMKLFF